MKKKVIALALALSMVVAGCTPAKPGDNNGGSDASTEASTSADASSDASSQDSADDQQAATDATGGMPWIDSDIQENILSVTNPSYKDDFNVAVNQEWAKTASIPDGYSSYGEFSAVSDIIKEKGIAALEDDSIEGHDAELARAYYNAYKDWDQRNELGLTPLKEILDDISTISTLDDLSAFFCDPERSFYVTTLVGVGNDTDLVESDKYVTYVTNPSFLLGDAAEYSEMTDTGEALKAGYLDLFTKLMTRMGYTEDEASAMYDSSFEFETQLAESSLTNEEGNSPDIYDKILNYYAPDELADLAPNFPIVDVIASVGYDKANKYLVMEPDAIKKISDLYTEENVAQIKDYLFVMTTLSMAGMLDEESFNDYLEMENSVYGSSGRLSDEEYAYSSAKSNLCEPVEKLYMAKYDATEVKADVTGICEDVVDVYREMLAAEDWLSDETKEYAIAKLDNIKINVVSPDKWLDYSSLDFTGMSYYEMKRALADFELKLDVSHTNGVVDKEIWDFSTLDTNAYYSPVDNSINILLGILDGNFYSPDMTKEEMYGGIGVVIGHEISHAFDTSGAQFDKDGNYANWWTDEDYAAFQDRAQKLIDYYNGITVYGDVKVNGANIQTEAIADMAGMKAMLTLAAKEENFDYEVFFKSFAQDWRGICYFEIESYYLQQDTHPLDYLRTNVTCQQFEEFYTAFDVKEGDGMYLAPEDRVAVW
ncbi:M13-type metalloendopeptidase [Butyrivibrio proteoclasticus]|uniref:M13-type metalloendopeptidase n=1 Tax=Butyrivibrio proteoclasticus TaxID=43305 RepID=UPI0004798B54|nr:M13 family metallopeptidase [Butyrivibrio proteoclasticus]